MELKQDGRPAAARKIVGFTADAVIVELSAYKKRSKPVLKLVRVGDLNEAHPTVQDRFSFRLGVLAGVRAAGG